MCEVTFCLLLCLRPAELIWCKSDRPLVLGVPVWSWKILDAKGVFPHGLFDFKANPFLPLVVPVWIVFPTSPRTRLGVIKGALLDWKDFAATKPLPVQKAIHIKQVINLNNWIQTLSSPNRTFKYFFKTVIHGIVSLSRGINRKNRLRQIIPFASSVPMYSLLRSSLWT